MHQLKHIIFSQTITSFVLPRKIILKTALDKGLVEQFLEAIMNREHTGFICNIWIQYIIGKLLSLLPLERLRHIMYSKLS